MQIILGHHESDADYIRHARIETLQALNLAPDPHLVEAIPTAKYLLAIDERFGQPIGMGEIALLGNVYSSFDQTPYHHVCDLGAYASLNQIYGMRTVYVEPEFRKSNMAFSALTFGAAKYAYSTGARFATASTRADDDYLNALYLKCGGERVGTFQVAGTNERSSLFVIDLEKTINHRVMKRLTQYVNFEFGEAVVHA